LLTRSRRSVRRLRSGRRARSAALARGVSVAIAIHGGAGLVQPNSLSPEREAACLHGLRRALDVGYAVLAGGGAAVDAVLEAVVALEDDPLFNAGRGAVLTAAGTVELDAAIMDGRERRAGAVASVTGVRNPVRLARLVMDSTPHVLMVGAGAEALAAEHGLPRAPLSYFRTDERVAQLHAAQGQPFALGSSASRLDEYGTVGAVARDRMGHLAAATSTGGMTNKRPGRVGDTPIIGAGTFAWDRTCAVSGTGHGEPYIRASLAARVSAYVELGGLSVAAAADRVIAELPELRGAGGLIAVGADGTIAMPFNTAGMFRASRSADGQTVIAIWR
jgi:L-asparaginase / beta-aspartyl-peptidase